MATYSNEEVCSHYCKCALSDAYILTELKKSCLFYNKKYATIYYNNNTIRFSL